MSDGQWRYDGLWLRALNLDDENRELKRQLESARRIAVTLEQELWARTPCGHVGDAIDITTFGDAEQHRHCLACDHVWTQPREAADQ